MRHVQIDDGLVLNDEGVFPVDLASWSRLTNREECKSTTTTRASWRSFIGQTHLKVTKPIRIRGREALVGRSAGRG